MIMKMLDFVLDLLTDVSVRATYMLAIIIYGGYMFDLTLIPELAVDVSLFELFMGLCLLCFILCGVRLLYKKVIHKRLLVTVCQHGANECK